MIANDLAKANFISIDKDETISRLIGKFQTSKKTAAIVLDGKKYLGIICKRKFLRARMPVYEEKIKHVVMKPAVLNGSESLEKTAKLLCDSDVHMLPVVKRGIPVGVVYAIDVLKNLKSKFDKRKIKDLSKGKVIALDQHTEIKKALSIMRQRKIDRAPLVNAKNKLSGIISIYDLLMKYAMFPVKRAGGNNIRESKSSMSKQRESSSVYVIHEATADVITVTNDDSVKNAIDLMSNNKISSVVVIDEYNQPAGIITIKDLLLQF